MEGGTESLRLAASQWSLAGDKDLLEALQSLHQRIMDKCNETNRKLDEMVTSLDDASVHLQNVNNKFTALSNTQFIESRVYDDDDTDITTDTAQTKVQQKQPTRESNMEQLKRSLQTLESFHETVTISILSDSDSESTDEEDDLARVVLKPKDLYSDRPLPHIIGSQAWKDKWHAGLIREDSDSDSDRSKRELREQYSDSEPEPNSESPSRDLHSHLPTGRDRTISSSSSGLHSEQDIPTVPTAAGPKPSQSDIAAELARRLGGATQKLPEYNNQEEYSPSPQPAVRKLYKPEQPKSAQIFSDEPPPLDFDQSENSDDDIFAEINRNQPYNQSNKEQSGVADDLFGRPVFDEIVNKIPSNPVAKQKPTLFDEESEPELFTEKPKATKTEDIRKPEEVGTKKPIGAKSLFGSNANSESIGAAILKRNQMKSSSSEDSDDNRAQVKPNDVTRHTKPNIKAVEAVKETKNTPKKERDIFDDLFARSEKLNKQNQEKKDEEVTKPLEKKVDLFNDNLFDDIDDIFTSNVVTTTVMDNKNHKSIFDDDDDDLFSDVAVAKNTNDNVNKTLVEGNNDMNKSKGSKNIFDTNEDLFSDKTPKVSQITKETDRLFDNDDDDDLFSDIKVTKPEPVTVKETKINAGEPKVNKKVTHTLFNDDDDDSDDLFTPKNSKNESEEKPKLLINDIVENSKEKSTKSSIIKSPDLFDDDNDDLFLNKKPQDKPSVNDKPKLNISNQQAAEEQIPKSKIVKSPDLFDDDDDDLFLTPQQKPKPKSVQEKDLEESVAKVHEFIKSNEEKYTSKELGVGGLKSKDAASKPDIATKPVQLPKDEFFENVLPNDNDQIFSKPTVAKTVVTTTVSETEVKAKTDNIFDDIEEDKELFAKTTLNKTKPDIAPKITTKVTKVEQTVIKSDIQTVIEKNVTSVSQTVSKENVFDETQAFDTNEPQIDIPKNDTEEESDITGSATPEESVRIPNELEKDQSATNIPTKDVFSDIFDDQPPEFEKPKEPKKSKNVNALFDDDSDDEALFFRKIDTTLDEKPEVYTSPTEDRVFGLFSDEPPPEDDFLNNITNKDVDTHSQRSDDISDGFSVTNNDREQIPSVEGKGDYFDEKIHKEVEKVANNSKPDDNVVPKTFGDRSNNDLVEKPQISKSKYDKELIKADLQDDNDLFKPKSPLNDEKQETPVINEIKTDVTDSVETKKVGKLKPMNFNINVNTLLPGASPKKTHKTTEETDGQTISTKSNEELHRNEDSDVNVESKMVKSVSFEGKPDSTILDNKLSKDRAKIQVKRRPSTRRARREAVKKSGIDFGEDTTDNSSSIDDPPPKVSSNPVQRKEVEREEFKSDENLPVEAVAKNDEVEGKSVHELLNSDDIDDLFHPKGAKTTADDSLSNDDEFDDIFKSKVDNNDDATKSIVKDPISTLSSDLDSRTSVTNDTVVKKVDEKTVTKTNIATIEPKDTNSNQTSGPETSRSVTGDVKSKVVYVLHDEDIFNTKPDTTSSKPTIFSNDDDDLFRKPAISTLGKVYKDLNPMTDIKADKNDKDLFKSVKTKEQTVKTEEHRPKQSLFDSDDDTELFSSKKIEKTPKANIFGSDSDEELFGKKQKENIEDRKRSKEKEASVEKEIRRVEVKGSLFGDDDDDDDDIFGAKRKSVDIKAPASKTNPTSKESNKLAELVTHDPLSLFGSDDE